MSLRYADLTSVTGYLLRFLDIHENGLLIKTSEL